MTRVVKFLDSMGNFVLAALFMIVWGGLALWPTSWWMEVKSVRVRDVDLPHPVIMLADRRIHRDFRGHWTVELRRQNGSDWVLMCTGTGNSWYRPSSALPDPLTLAWWAGDGCRPTTSGVYRVDTTWRITDRWFPDRYLSVESNTFRVTGDAQ